MHLYTGFTTICAAIQIFFFFQGKHCIFQQDSAKPNTVSITTAMLCGRRLQGVNWPVVQASHQLNTFGATGNEKI